MLDRFLTLISIIGEGACINRNRDRERFYENFRCHTWMVDVSSWSLTTISAH